MSMSAKQRVVFDSAVEWAIAEEALRGHNYRHPLSGEALHRVSLMSDYTEQKLLEAVRALKGRTRLDFQ